MNNRDNEIFFKGTILAAERKIKEAAKEGKTEIDFYGDYEYADPKEIGTIFETQGFKYHIEGAMIGWKIIFNWE